MNTILICYLSIYGNNKVNKNSLSPTGTDDHHMVLMECNSTLYACSRSDLHKYDLDLNTWHTCCKVNLDPSQLIVSDENSIYFYNLEEGIVQIMRLDRDFQVTKQVSFLLIMLCSCWEQVFPSHAIITVVNHIPTTRT